MKKTKTMIALLHHTGGGNLGDDATMDVVIRNIRQRWPEAEIVAFSMNPEDTGKKYEIPSYPIRRHRWSVGYRQEASQSVSANENKLFRRLKTSSNPAIRIPRTLFYELAFLFSSWRILKPFDLLLVSGGGQLTERSGPWGFPYAIFIWILMAKLAGLKCKFLSVGAGPLRHPVSKFLVARSLYMADYVSFRDEPSKKVARTAGFKGESHVYPDNVYNLDVTSVCASSVERKDPVVGIAPMPYPFCDPREHPADRHQAMYEEYIGKLAACASSLVRYSCSLELFGSDVGADPSAIEDMRKVLQHRYNISTPPYKARDSVNKLLLQMCEMDYVVTCRFHGVVFAHLLNKPVLAIAHHPKVTDLMHALGQGKYCFDIQGFDPDVLADAFADLVANTQAVKSSMAASASLYKSKLIKEFDMLFPPAAANILMPQVKLVVHQKQM